MKLKDLGERKLLEIAKEICDAGPGIELGVGDDGAVIDLGDEYLLVSTDMVAEGYHFTSATSAQQIGRKAVVTNLSDISAMGGKPLGLVYSMGAPGESDADFLIDILKAMNSTAKEYDTYIVGGDLNDANSLLISGTAVGLVEKGNLLTRNDAKPGDIIGISGKVGQVPAAVRAILDDKISSDDWLDLVHVLDELEARVREGKVLGEVGVNSCIDVTDGVALNLWQISKASKVSLKVDRDKIPAHPMAIEFSEREGVDLEELLFYGGEEFELLFTVSPENWDVLVDNFEEIGTEVTKIGKVESGEGVSLLRDGSEEVLPDEGYEHFR